jgi:serine/threonine protein kinase
MATSINDFDNSYLEEKVPKVPYPEEIIHTSCYFVLSKVTVDRRHYVYKKCRDGISEAVKDTLRREFEIGQRLDHTVFQKYLAIGSDSNGPLLIKEFIPGSSLRSLLSNKGFQYSKQECFNWMGKLFDAIEYLHSQGITHGDVSLSNIIIDHFNRSIYLIDLGHSVSPRHANVVGGTVGYTFIQDAQCSFEERVAHDLKGLLAVIEKLTADKMPSCSLACKNLRNSTENVHASKIRTVIKSKRRSRNFRVALVSLPAILLFSYLWLSEGNNYNRPQLIALENVDALNFICKDTIGRPSESSVRSYSKESARRKDSLRVANFSLIFLEELKDSLNLRDSLEFNSFNLLRSRLNANNFVKWERKSAWKEYLMKCYGYIPETWYQQGNWTAFEKSNELFNAWKVKHQ